MLIGEYRHNLDDKKRLALPAGLRPKLGKKVVLTRGLDNCLFVYPLAQWQKLTEELEKLPMGQVDARNFSRFLFAGAVETELDSLGRILIPDYLKDFAGLKGKVVIVGVSRRVELWDEERWQENTSKIERQADLLAEKLGEIGLI